MSNDAEADKAVKLVGELAFEHWGHQVPPSQTKLWRIQSWHERNGHRLSKVNWFDVIDKAQAHIDALDQSDLVGEVSILGYRQVSDRLFSVLPRERS